MDSTGFFLVFLFKKTQLTNVLPHWFAVVSGVTGFFTHWHKHLSVDVITTVPRGQRIGIIPEIKAKYLIRIIF